MTIIQILLFVVGSIFAAIATTFLFFAWLIVLIFMLVTAPSVLFVKNASMSAIQSRITGSFDWTVKTSSDLWTNMSDNIRRM